MYAQLPKEIRLEILRHTDLITPTSEIEWNSRDKYQIRINERDYSSRSIHPCTTHLNLCPCRLHWDNPTDGFIPQCLCWKPPISLFLVSKQFREDAMEIFFGYNNFVITPSCLIYSGTHEEYPEHGLREFLLFTVSKSALKYIRRLEIVFVLVAPYDTQIDQRLKETLEDLKDEFNMRILTVMLRLLDDGPSPVWTQHGAARDKDGVTLFQREKWSRLMDLLVIFKRAKNFYVNLTWSYKSIESEKAWSKWWMRFEIPYIEAAENEAERYVMGDDYVATGKQEYSESAWVLESRRGNMFTGYMPGPRKQRKHGVIKHIVK
jgi:hypothetical protein